MALMGHGAFNSTKIRFNYIVNKNGVGAKLTKITAKSKKKDNRQSHIFQISKQSMPKCF